MRFVIFTLAGAMASFGAGAGNAHRGTTERPTHSMVAGLMSAALGIRREEEARLRALSDALRVASRADDPGRPLTDYHTAQSVQRAARGPTPATRADLLRSGEPVTTLTTRDYLCGVRFTVAAALDGWDEGDADTLAAALRRPRFVLYLGRKACPPALPLDPLAVEADDADAALAAYDARSDRRAATFWPAHGGPRAQDARLPDIAGPARRVTRRTRPRRRAAWTFDELDELVLPPREPGA